MTTIPTDAVEHPFPVATLLEQARSLPLAEGRVAFLLPGAVPSKARTEYRRIGDRWKPAITEAMVDAYVGRAGKD